MIKITRYLVVVPALFLALPGMAESPSYDFIQASYQSVELDFGGGFSEDGDGFSLGGSFEIGEHMFGFASYGRTDFDFDVEFTQLQAGLGYRVGINDSTDFFATASYLDAEVSAPGFGSADDSGYGLGIGIRSNVTDLVEL